MDKSQQKQVNEAAEKFAEAIKESYQALADRSVSAQEINTQLTQESVNAYMDFLNSMFALPRESTKTAEGAVQEASTDLSAGTRGAEGPTQDDAVRHPLSSFMESASDTPDAPPVEGVAPEDAPLPGEGQTAREEPPPGEERPE